MCRRFFILGIYFLVVVGCMGKRESLSLSVIYIDQDHKIVCYEHGKRRTLSALDKNYPYPYLISDSIIYVLPSKHFLLEDPFDVVAINYDCPKDEKYFRYYLGRTSSLKIVDGDTILLSGKPNHQLQIIDNLLLFSFKEEIDPVNVKSYDTTRLILNDDFSNYIIYQNDTIRPTPPYRFKNHYLSHNKHYWVATVVKAIKEDYDMNTIVSVALVYDMIEKKQLNIVEVENLEAAQISEDGKYLLLSRTIPETGLCDFVVREIATGRQAHIGSGCFAAFK